jgi:hypothetical protein
MQRLRVWGGQFLEENQIEFSNLVGVVTWAGLILIAAAPAASAVCTNPVDARHLDFLAAPSSPRLRSGYLRQFSSAICYQLYAKKRV